MDSSSNYLKQYQDFTNSRLTPEAYVKKYSAELGADKAKESVNAARGIVRSTQDTLKAVPDSVSGRTSGSLVTDAQRNRLVQNEVAPLNEALGAQTQAYSDANVDYKDILSMVQNRTALDLQGDETKSNTIMNLYKAASEAERAAEEKRLKEAQMAEERRQFDAQLAESRASRASAAGGFSLGGGGGGGSSAAPTAKMDQRSSDKGFNFSVGGKAVSAATYAQLTGQSFRGLLQKMADKGDYGAKQALQYVGDDFGVNANKLKGYESYTKSNQMTNIINSLLWGVNRI